MEQRLLSLTYALVDELKYDKTDPAKLSEIASVCAWRLLTAPLFEGGHEAHWFLGKNAKEEVGLYQRWRDEIIPRSPMDLYEDQKPKGEIIPIEATAISADTHAVVEHMLNSIKEGRSTLWRRLFEPCEHLLKERHTILYERLTPDELEDRLGAILGDEYSLDGNLRTQGLEYHTPPQGYPATKGQYILAHNGREVAGVLFLSDEKWNYNLNYLTVGPAFRQQGISKEMFKRAVGSCVAEQKAFVRTAPGVWAAQRTEIGQAYDQICQQANVLHATHDSALANALAGALAMYDYPTVFDQFKPICDTFSVGPDRKQSASSAACALACRSALDGLTSPPSPGRRARP